MPAASTAAAADIIERVDGSCVHADRNTSLCPELLPMKPIFDSTGVQTTTNVNKPKSALHIPCNATKNNLIKLNWWNSTVAQPNSATSSTIISKGPCIATNLPPTKDNNNTTTEQSSFNTPTPEHLHHRRCSNERDQMWKPPITSADVSMTLDLDETFDLQESQLLVKEPKPYMAVLNQDQQDQMKISGYRRSHLRLILCWICICLTGGLLRLVLHWWRHWYLIATCQPCPLEEAQQVLVEEDYQGKHKLYHVKSVQIITIQHLKNLFYEKVPDETIDDNKLQLSVHFSSAHFKSCRTLRTFRCKQLVYAWDSGISNFNKINGLDVNVPCSYFHQQRGLALHEQLSRGIVFGVNEITVPLKDVKTLLFLEVLNPFYVFQIFSVILWFTYDYYYYACVIMLMSIFGITMSIIQTKKNQNVLHKTVLNTGHALVVNAKGVPREVLTSSLVPGDIIEIPTSGCTMQCDAVLLSGNCIMDESMLTGESVPVTKTPLPMKRDVIFDKKEHVRHTLFCGTKVIQTRYIGSKKVLAFVINTGNVTAKGGLIRSILYPPPVDYKFEQDSYKFIQCLALIAFVGFIYTLVTKILRGTDATKLIVESLDLITIVVPPALPAAMTVGRFYAQKRLKHNDIYCISPRSINVAGSIDCCCFDKTGTLTEDGMDMWGVVPKSSTNQFQIPLKDIGRLPYDHFLFGMVTCHSITVMNGTMTGDPLDLKMFESTGWILEDFNNIPENEKYGLIYPTILRQPNRVNLGTESKAAPAPVIRQSSVDDLLANVGLSQSEMHFDHGIVREFPFASNLQRMAVITRCLSARGFNVYCKGSPEMIQQLCLPQTLPDDYTQQLSMFAKQGFRIIALGFKALSPKINYTKVQRLSRDDVEHNLEFLGFVIMENRLKADTTAVINSLNLANIRTIMITGDNILTAMSVARDCGIVSSSQAVVTVHAVPSSSPSDNKIDSNHQHQHTQYQLQYTLELGSETINMAAPAPTLNGNKTCLGAGAAFVQHIELSQSNNSLMNSCDSSCTTSVLPNSNSLTSVKTVDTWTHNDDNVDVEIGVTSSQSLNNQQHDCWRQNYTFAMDGNTWQIVHDRFPNQMANILTRGAIYARMSPEQKQALIVELQNLDYYVAMCGDGANDCGALKVAHTGISLSETESSIASPFTSRKPTIAAVPMVIKEGRAALVTSFGIFKYMAAYSLVQFISVMILYSINSNLTDKQYLYIDLGLISVFAFFFGKTEAYAGQLVSQVPLSSLISATPLASLLLHLAAVIVFQVAGWLQLHQQTWFQPFVQTADNEHLGCYENYTMFAISSFQYVILAFVFSKGAPYRKPIWSNWPLCLTMAINLAIIIYLVVYPSEWISQFFQLVVPPEISFRLVMLSYGVAAFITHVLIETFIIEYWLFQHCQVQREKNPCTSTRKYMQLQYDMQSFDKWPPITDAFGVHDSTSSDPPTTEMQQPTYVNLSAEQHPDAVQYGIFPGFFENVTTQNAVND